MIDLQAF